MANLLGNLAAIDEDEEDEEESGQEQKSNSKSDIVIPPNPNIPHKIAKKVEDKYTGNKPIKINEEEANEIRLSEIMKQVEEVSEDLEKNKTNTHNNDGEEIDLENLDLDWHYHTPSAH
ncbi:hypothetical protein TRFO_14251 [Tritrichomonas foetus]|uniref:Uncharacterized protein n=1 Tax=Tritrichomonas foetus TaxID=1144522 RepID=A0A1J4L051_9EUKA|nr:hypothetical protein TRFO_14251 [Tritrichomonas foetus]|eukprot:OHT15229.1 hypothetical protein TRFO_14251 [Tritrichomonas foetus]